MAGLHGGNDVSHGHGFMQDYKAGLHGGDCVSHARLRGRAARVVHLPYGERRSEERGAHFLIWQHVDTRVVTGSHTPLLRLSTCSLLLIFSPVKPPKM